VYSRSFEAKKDILDTGMNVLRLNIDLKGATHGRFTLS
jgi:hypothetical protein